MLPHLEQFAAAIAFVVLYNSHCIVGSQEMKSPRFSRPLVSFPPCRKRKFKLIGLKMLRQSSRRYSCRHQLLSKYIRDFA